MPTQSGLLEIAERLRLIQGRNMACETLAGRQLEVEAALLGLLVSRGTYETDAVIESAVHVAVELIHAMPTDVPMPEVGVDPDGCVVLDWLGICGGASISIGRSGRLAFSWLLGSESGHAVYDFGPGNAL